MLAHCLYTYPYVKYCCSCEGRSRSHDNTRWPLVLVNSLIVYLLQWSALSKYKRRTISHGPQVVVKVQPKILKQKDRKLLFTLDCKTELFQSCMMCGRIQSLNRFIILLFIEEIFRTEIHANKYGRPKRTEG